ncbi:MAG: hypothetical protein QXL88_01095 [Candidatus Pacearchaeota archaeon]
MENTRRKILTKAEDIEIIGRINPSGVKAILNKPKDANKISEAK